MCARTYETGAKLQKEENVLYATWYTGMPSNFSFYMGAKTGYEVEAGSCLASLIKGPDGKEYVIVTGKASYPGRENTFKDVKTLYDNYIK
jgi:D-alanyl-D-alanine carboxypeptidase